MLAIVNTFKVARSGIILSAILALSLGARAKAQEVDGLEFQRHINASTEAVWEAWTTVEGARSFFSKDAVIQGRVDGEYSILFFPDNPPGSRGAENMRILAFEPAAGRFAFTWSSPPTVPYARGQRTMVEVLLEEGQNGGTDLVLYHYGWGQAEDWPAARDYFKGAWEVVLNRLEYRFKHGPVDWSQVSEIDGLYYSG